MPARKSTDKKELSERAVTSFIRALDRAYSDWRTLIARAFVTGMFTALGATVGLALILYLIGVILTKLGVLPGVGEFFARLNEIVTMATGGR